MDFGVIAPINIMEEVAGLSETSMYLYHMFDNQRYRERFLKDTNYRILDNGVFELNELPSEKGYIQRITDLSPEEIIAPDIPFNCSETIRVTNEFIEKYREFLGNISVQAVVQARSLSEAVICYREYSENPLIDTIGLPFRMRFDIGGREGERKDLIEILNKEGLLNTSKDLHLLGLKSIREVVEIAKMGVVRSCDSSKFYRHAVKGIFYEYEFPNKNSHEALDFQEESDRTCLNLLRTNLEVLKCKIRE